MHRAYSAVVLAPWDSYSDAPGGFDEAPYDGEAAIDRKALACQRAARPPQSVAAAAAVVLLATDATSADVQHCCRERVAERVAAGGPCDFGLGDLGPELTMAAMYSMNHFTVKDCPRECLRSLLNKGFVSAADARSESPA